MDENNFIINDNCLLKINLDRIGQNYKKIQKRISKNSEISAVLKSNAYGLGLENIAKKLIKIGCKSFFLNTFKEALYLRKICPSLDIYLLNGLVNINYEDMEEVLDKNIIPVINSSEELEKLVKFKKSHDDCISISLHFDTGINRLGIRQNELANIKDTCKKNHIKVKCVMSHLIASDEKTILNKEQKKKFDEIIKNFPNAILSISNSNAIINYKSMNYGMVRSGGNIFGVTSDDFTQSFDLYARVLQITRAEEGLNHFGYNSTFKSTELKRIAILGFGYADGYPRLLSNKGEVFFKKRLSIIGTISMDYTIVDISTLDDGQIKVGDWVELIGENINIKEISKKSQTIPYEILINICSRAKKQYID